MSTKHSKKKSKSKKYNKKKRHQEKYSSEDDNANSSIESNACTTSEDAYSSLSGGETDDELGDDSATLDIDPDDEQDIDSNEDDKYDPVNEMGETEDPAEISDVDDTKTEEEEEEIGSEAQEDEFTAETKQCHLKNLNKDFIVLDEDDSNMYGKMEYKKIPDKNRECDPIMTYYEMVRIIGVRAQQFNFGAEPLVSGLEGLHPAKMAYLELISKMTPFVIRRPLPGKKYEDWHVHELDIIHEIDDNFFIPEKFDLEALMKEASYLNKRAKKNVNDETDNMKRISDKISKSTPDSKKTNSKRSGSKRSGSKRSGSKRSDSKRSGSKKTNSKRSGSKKTNSKKTNSKRSGSKNV